MAEIQQILSAALKSSASDCFLTGGKPPRFRFTGAVRTSSHFPDALIAEAIDQFREQVLGQNAEAHYRKNGSADTSYVLPDGAGRFRINFLNASGMPGLVARPLRRGDELFLKELNLPDVLAEFAMRPRGLILICGSAGSGKSTTLSAMVNHINRHAAKHIVTVEDPVEYLHQDFESLVTQREINADVSSFADALRSAVRESPDVIVVGEMRDAETVSTAITAALTGHLVISTVHTADAVQAIERIVNLFPEGERRNVAADLSGALQAVIAQRLLPGNVPAGQLPAVEYLSGTPLVRKRLGDQDFSGIEELMKRNSGTRDYQTFNRDLLRLVTEEKCSMEDALDAASNQEEFLLLLKGMESGVDTFRDKLAAVLPQKQSELTIQNLLDHATNCRASDLLISAGNPPIVRVDGELMELPLPVLSGDETQRLLFSVLSTRQRVEFESNREIDLALAVKLHSHAAIEPGNASETKNESVEELRFRVNGFFQRGSVGIAIRAIPDRIPSAEALGLPQVLTALTEKHQGLILITGPTGHGKSTTQACLIDRINRTRSCHIITIEDPIEYAHSNQLAVIEQREVHADTLSFSNALKYVLRQDPDVILIGEMRDPETIAAALTAAETGHLVLATLHTNNAPQTIDRIIDSFPAHQQNQIRIQLSGTILAVVAQRLLPRKGGEGRIAAFEIMTGTDPIRALIRDGKTSQLKSVLETSYKDGMITMDKALSELYAANLIAREEYRSLTRDFRDSKEFQ